MAPKFPLFTKQKYLTLYAEVINLGKKNTNFSYNRFTPSPRYAINRFPTYTKAAANEIETINCRDGSD